MSFYGLALKPNFLGGDPYITFISMASFELLSPIAFYLLINRLGRKFLLLICYSLAAVFLVVASNLTQS